jgi:hypothetical protein
MHTPRRIGLLLLFALVLTACPRDGAGPATTTSPTLDTATTADSDGLLPIPEASTAGCFYLRGYLVVEEGQGEAAIAALGGFDVEVEVVSAGSVLGEETPETEILDAAFDVLSTDGDPFDVATVLQDVQITAGPIYAAGLAAHWALKPGTDPISRPGVTLPDPTGDLGDGIIAVVDSGLAIDPQLPDWMSPEHVLYDTNLDTETISTDPGVASHGTFVTSVIRQLAPEFRVAFASAQPRVPVAIVERDDTLPPDVPLVSTQLHVAEAIVRLTERSELGRGSVAALNLSLGTYACDPGEDPTMITTMAAMRIWFGAFPDSTIFAAGGNEPYQAPFWPAGLSTFPLDGTIDPDRVRGVGAVNEAAQQVVWAPVAGATASVAPQRPPQRAWVTDTAPGCDLLGLRGGVDGDGATVVAWSGSSFATAVSAALSATIPPNSVGPSTDLDYSVPGLSFERLGSCDIP